MGASYRVVTCPLSGMWVSTRARNFRGRIPRAVAREAFRERPIVHRDPHRRVHVKPRVRPREHPGGLVLVEEFAAHEEPEHGAAECVFR